MRETEVRSDFCFYLVANSKLISFDCSILQETTFCFLPPFVCLYIYLHYFLLFILHLFIQLLFSCQLRLKRVLMERARCYFFKIILVQAQAAVHLHINPV